MLTEKCINVINKIQQQTATTDPDIGPGCNPNCQQNIHAPLHRLITNVYLCNAPLSLEQLHAHRFTHIINIDHQWFQNNSQTPTAVVDASDPSVQFELLNLHFGETYRMQVLPNVYRAVKFLEKALENSGKVLIGEEMGHQKTATIVIGFIMYRHRLKFVEAFHIVRRLCTLNLVLETYLIAQLCEYEPILQTQRRALLGSSCSGELRSTRLKRKQHPADSPTKTASHTDLLSLDYASVNNNNNNNNCLGLVQKMET